MSTSLVLLSSVTICAFCHNTESIFFTHFIEIYQKFQNFKKFKH